MSAIYLENTIIQILPQGVRVKFAWEPWTIIGWEEFQEVCVCYANYATKGRPGATKIVCFVKRGEKRSFLTGRWKTEGPIFHYRSILRPVYSDELYEIVKEHCPYKVPDLCHTVRYRLHEDYYEMKKRRR